MKYTLTVEVEDFHPNAKNVGECIKISDRKYRLRIDAKDALIIRVGTMYHEITHFICWIVFAADALKDSVEELLCRHIDRFSKRAWLKAIRGKLKAVIKV